MCDSCDFALSYLDWVCLAPCILWEADDAFWGMEGGQVPQLHRGSGNLTRWRVVCQFWERNSGWWVASRVRVWGREALGPVLVAGGRY